MFGCKVYFILPRTRHSNDNYGTVREEKIKFKKQEQYDFFIRLYIYLNLYELKIKDIKIEDKKALILDTKYDD